MYDYNISRKLFAMMQGLFKFSVASVPRSVRPLDTPYNFVSILYLPNFQELVIAIKHPKGLMQEAHYNFLNINKKARQKVHQTFVGDGRYNT